MDATFKICIFGDGGVGKTTLIRRYLTGIFNEGTNMTIGVDFHIKALNINGSSVGLQIWDFAGEDRFRFLLPSYVRGASGGIFMYDITRYSSLKNLQNWFEVFNGAVRDRQFQIPILMVGGKKDLEHKRAVEKDYARELAQECNCMGHLECSAKTGQNVEQIFEMISSVMLNNAGLLRISL